MDSGVITLLDQTIELSMQKGEALGDPVPEAPIARLSEFLRSELVPGRGNVQPDA